MVEQATLEQIQQRAEGKRPRGGVPATTMEVDLAVGHAHAQWWSLDLKPKLEVNSSAAVDGVDGATSAWVADECNRALGQELPEEEEEMHADLVNEGKSANWRHGRSSMSSPLSMHVKCRNN